MALWLIIQVGEYSHQFQCSAGNVTGRLWLETDPSDRSWCGDPRHCDFIAYHDMNRVLSSIVFTTIHHDGQLGIMSAQQGWKASFHLPPHNWMVGCPVPGRLVRSGKQLPPKKTNQSDCQLLFLFANRPGPCFCHPIWRKTLRFKDPTEWYPLVSWLRL